jgi:hypothetical protein
MQAKQSVHLVLCLQLMAELVAHQTQMMRLNLRQI